MPSSPHVSLVSKERSALWTVRKEITGNGIGLISVLSGDERMLESQKVELEKIRMPEGIG